MFGKENLLTREEAMDEDEAYLRQRQRRNELNNNSTAATSDKSNHRRARQRKGRNKLMLQLPRQHVVVKRVLTVDACTCRYMIAERYNRYDKHVLHNITWCI
jgi:hypothetical protein